MKIPYIKISQKNEVFFVTKIKANELKNRINFHFREPYSKSPEIVESYMDYISKLRRKGIEIKAEEEGIQRRIQLNRINKIKTYLEDQEDSFFPTSIVLAVDVSNDENFEKQYENIENKDFGYITLSDNVSFQIVDGQHRLAGLFISNDNILNNFEVTAILLINATAHTCAKIFTDINGNQTPVNRSVIYDLYDLVESSDNESTKWKALHSICKKFNYDPESPLYLHLKMLGIGNGAISQAFFIQYLDDAIKSINLDYTESQSIYDALFLYLKCFQKLFKEQWPVLPIGDYKNSKEFLNHSKEIMKIMKSQILKTNGFGAIMMLFPKVFTASESISYNNYYNILKSIKGKIDWSKDEILIQGTGKKESKKMRDKLENLLNL